MNENNIKLKCHNRYCVFNKENKCVKVETSINRIGVCEDMFLINADRIENLQKLKHNYLQNMFIPTDKIMQDDIEWHSKRVNAKEVHPLEEVFEEAKKLINNEKRTKH